MKLRRRDFILKTMGAALLFPNFKTQSKAMNLENHPNLICLWDFDQKNPFVSKGKYAYRLREGNEKVDLLPEGILSSHSVQLQKGKFLTIPRSECKALNIHGKDAQVTVLAWIKRKPKFPIECEAIAGMWNETEKKRQYCLFTNIRLHNSSDQVCGHISGVGGPTPNQKWCTDVSIGKKPIVIDEWTFVAMTYDGKKIYSYHNGELDSSEHNPYSYEEGIFSGGGEGSDFTVGAVHRQGEIGNYFIGQLGGLTVFNKALSPTEIHQIHEEHPLPNPPRIENLFTGLNFPEGPAFASDGSLWAVELKGEALVHITDGTLTRYKVGGMPNGIAIDKKDTVWFCDAGNNAIRTFDPHTGKTENKATMCDGHMLDKPNDLAFDPMGNLVFTCPGNSRQEPTGYVCVLTPTGSVKKITQGKFFPNGLAFTADGKKLVIAETYKHRLWIGDWDAEKGQWLNEKVWCEIGGPDGPGGPDGMAYGTDGNLYVAVYGTGSVRVVNQQGQVAFQITTPGKNPTNCAFDPSGKWGLVITEAEKGELLNYQTSLSGIKLF